MVQRMRDLQTKTRMIQKKLRELLTSLGFTRVCKEKLYNPRMAPEQVEDMEIGDISTEDPANIII